MSRFTLDGHASLMRSRFTRLLRLLRFAADSQPYADADTIYAMICCRYDMPPHTPMIVAAMLHDIDAAPIFSTTTPHAHAARNTMSTRLIFFDAAIR